MDESPNTLKAWHGIRSEDAAEALQVDPETGLTETEAEARAKRFGRNELTRRQGTSGLQRFLAQFRQPLIYILLAASVVAAFLQEWVDSAVIFGVVLVNAIVGYLQEAKAIDAINSLSRFLTREAVALRDGKKAQVDSVELVPGDIVLLLAGDQVPADARLLWARELKVAEAALTGESLPVDKLDVVLDPGASLADRTNMVYSSTLVTNGQGKALVTATGDRTEIGKISTLVAESEVLETPLTRNIGKFSHLLLYVILALSAVTFVFGIATGQPTVDMFMAAVALAVAMIPEGLPAALTITLAIGVHRMAQHKAIIRKLPAVETLGSTSVICSDKTGTLTQNEMTVTEIWAGGTLCHVEGIGYEPEGELKLQDRGGGLEGNRVLMECIRAGYLCNDSQHVKKDGRWTIQGDPTEGSLLVVAKKSGLPVEQWEKDYPRVGDIPFESEHQYMATLHDTPEGKRITYLKGGVEKVLERCTAMAGPDGRPAPLDPEAVRSETERMAEEGLRVLVFASREEPGDRPQLEHDNLDGGFVLLGLQGMLDPPRAEAIQAVRACRQAGILVKMITGDHLTTAAAIARKIGIIDERGDIEHAHAINGRDLEQKMGPELEELAEHSSVFARVTPEQKLRLVEALQARGHIVAMTGDGVNDAPALKRANIGVAMGITGTDVSKDAADMVLTDDNFATLEEAVEEGRGIYDNIVKYLVFSLPTNLGQGLVILTAVLLQTTLPILPVQILWVNMTTAILLGLTLAFEAKELGLMRRAPRPARSPIVTRDFYLRMILVGLLFLGGAFGLFYMEMAAGASADYARTVAVNVFIVAQTFYLFNCRSLTKSMFEIGLGTNKIALGGAAAMILAQLAFTYVPFMNVIFHTEPIAASAWLPIIGIGAVTYLVVEAEKTIRRRFDAYLPQWRPAPKSA